MGPCVRRDDMEYLRAARRASHIHWVHFFKQHVISRDTVSHSRRAIHASFAGNVLPSEIRGRRECRALDAPVASRAIKNKAHEHSRHGHTGYTRHSPRNGFNGFLRALPGDQACLTPSPALLLTDLTPALGRQNHTTSPSASARFVKRAARVHRIPHPTSVTIAKRPSEEAGPNRYSADFTRPSSENSENQKLVISGGKVDMARLTHL